MHHKELKDKDIYDILEKAGLTEEIAACSRKIRMMRNLLIYRYVYQMNREEVCAKLDFISLRTYNNILTKALAKIGKYI